MMRSKIILHTIGWGLLLILITVSCKKFADPEMVFEKEPESIRGKIRKVLVISVDGLSGLELKKYLPTNMSKLLDHSKYTLDGFSGEDTGDAATWATIVSGKSHAQHGVSGNSFVEDFEEDESNPIHGGSGDSKGYISVFQRLLESGKSMKSLSVTSWDLLDEYAFSYSDNRVLVENDLKTRDAAVDSIKNGRSNLALSFVNFRGLIAVGKSGGFSVENPNFKSTLDQIDEYIGDVIAATRERQSSSEEDWLIILTSNHGANDRSYGGSTLHEMSNFSIYYNPNFSKAEMKGEAMEYLRYHGWYPNESLTTGGVTINSGTELGVHAVGQGGAAEDIFNINHTGELTVEFKANFAFKMMSHPGHSYYNTFNFMHQNIISKDAVATSDIGTANTVGWDTPGWTITPYGTDSYMVGLNDGRTDGKGRAALTVKGRINQGWQHVAVTFKKIDKQTEVAIFIDGTERGRTVLDIDANKLTNADPLVLGFNNKFNYGLVDLFMADVRFWNRSLNKSQVEKVACTPILDSGDPLYQNMISYYRTEGEKGVFKNEKEAAPQLNITGKYNFIAGKNHSPCLEGHVMGSMDIVSQIYYWLNINTADSWELEGQVFLDQYEQEFIGK